MHFRWSGSQIKAYSIHAVELADNSSDALINVKPMCRLVGIQAPKLSNHCVPRYPLGSDIHVLGSISDIILTLTILDV